MAEVTLEGWLAKDAELRYAPSGAAVVNFDIPDNHRKKQGNESMDDGSTWYRVSKWASGGQGQPNNGPVEALAAVLQKGTRVVVRGDLRMTEREHNGTTYKNLEINARSVGIVPQAPRNGGGQAPAQQQGWSQPQQAAPQGDPWVAPQGGTGFGGWNQPHGPTTGVLPARRGEGSGGNHSTDEPPF